jgi:hypothetical protein
VKVFFFAIFSKKEYRKSFTELLRIEAKTFVHGVCYFANKIPKFIYKKEKEVKVQDINSIILELRDVRVY